MKDFLNKCSLSRIIYSFVLLILSALLAFSVNQFGTDFIEKPVVNEITETTEAEGLTDNLIKEDTLTITYPAETEITVNQAVLTITGVCKNGNLITINDIQVTCLNDGSFSYDYTLTPGDNKITVSNSDQTILLNVKYNYTVIKSVSPSKSVTVDGGTTLELSVVALKGSQVNAKINGQTITLKEVESEAAATGEEFVDFSGSYTTPSSSFKKQNLGKIVFSGTINGYTQTQYGASININEITFTDIYVNAGQGDVVAPKIKGDGKVDVLTPDSDYGLGTAKICKTTVDYCETMPSNVGDDFSIPTFTPLLYGTYDYIIGSATFDGENYYNLNSGRKIKQSECSVVNGNIMPINTISAYKSYTDNDTNVILTMNWKVPFNAEIKNQQYYKGYRSGEFNVSSCTSSYIDFKFYYTNAAEGEFDLSGSNVVSRAEWINIGDSCTTTLRVYLKNKGVFYGYSAYYSNDNRLVIAFNNKPANVSSAVVALDPGHGGRDCGAIGVNGVYESKVNFAISAMVKSNLEAAGVKVVMTRYNDSEISLDQRQKRARDIGADLFVAIHNNSTETGKGTLSGPEVYYYRANSKAFASGIHSNLVSAWKDIYADDSYMRDKVIAKDGGIRFYAFRVTRIEECPAVLVECGYLSNSSDCEKLCYESNQAKLARAISDGIINTLQSY